MRVRPQRGSPDPCSESGLDEPWYRIPESRRASGGVRLSTVITAGSGQLRWVPAGLRVRTRVQRDRLRSAAAMGPSLPPTCQMARSPTCSRCGHPGCASARSPTRGRPGWIDDFQLRSPAVLHDSPQGELRRCSGRQPSTGRGAAGERRCGPDPGRSPAPYRCGGHPLHRSLSPAFAVGRLAGSWLS